MQQFKILKPSTYNVLGPKNRGKSIDNSSFEQKSQEFLIKKYPNCKHYFSYGQKHREGDLPAVIFDTGYKEYWKNGNLHRVNGPAIIFSDGTKLFYLEGRRLTYRQWLVKRLKY